MQPEGLLPNLHGPSLKGGLQLPLLAKTTTRELINKQIPPYPQNKKNSMSKLIKKKKRGGERERAQQNHESFNCIF